MVKNSFIIILAALLCISSYLLYTNKNISIISGGAGSDCDAESPGREKR